MKRAMALVTGFGLLLGSACRATDVTVAQAGPTFEGGAEAPCSSNADCLPEEYCSKPSCGDGSGLCEMRPPSCPDSYQAVCGCDGVVYWNDCLRMRDAVSSSTAGPCTGDIPFTLCGGHADAGCPVDDAYCNKLIAGPDNHCELPSEGVCWVLPDECPGDGGPAKWATCGPPAPTCVSQCDAVRAGRPYRMAPMLCE